MKPSLRPSLKSGSFESRVKTALEQELESMPESSADAIRERRRQAIANAKLVNNPSSQQHPQSTIQSKISSQFEQLLAGFSSWPRTAMASAICLVLILAIQHPTDTSSSAWTDANATIAMMDSLDSDEDMDVLTDPEFYWFASVIEDDNA